MFYTGQKNLNLVVRNEGKIKAYESCCDVRAWSHDIEAQDRYIRDWIRSDMPIGVIPVGTVSSCLKAMTRKCRGRTTPRCYPNCKSKAVLDSICNSCHAIKECLKNDENFERYFVEEEFETSHWPCEKCLDALKNIKMFWKIIMERIFKISFPKNDNFESACCSNESVQNVAKKWQEELVHQAVIVKNLTPIISNQLNEKPSYCWKSYTKYLKKIITLDNLKFIVVDDDEIESKKGDEKICECKDKAIETDHIKPSEATIKRRNDKLSINRISKCTSFRVKTVDFGSSACNIDTKEITMYKNNLNYLRQKYNAQSDELKQLKTENTLLKLQLKDTTKSNSPSYATAMFSDNSASDKPKPYESYCEKEENIKDIDSEMIITMKNCEHENFKHVSMLQVLHKSNSKRTKNEYLDKNNYYCCEQRQDPIQILTKVHNTFGAIVRRELMIANKRKCDPKQVEIDASYRVRPSMSAPSCSKVSSKSTLSSVFVSTTQVQDQCFETSLKCANCCP